MFASLRLSREQTALVLQIAEAVAPEKASQLREHLEIVKKGVEEEIFRAWGLKDEDDTPLPNEESQ